LRERYQTDWAFAIFVANSEGNGTFADGYFAYAYVGGPFFVMTYNNAGYGIANMDAVVSHETGHVFRALDQYSSANISCSTRSGYLGVETQNSQRAGCASDVSSIMRGGIYPYTANAIDPYARGQVGWQDSDEDGVLDPIDTLPGLTISSTTHSGMLWTYSGQAADTPFPSPLRPDTTINDVSVEYSLDGGAWQPAVAADGAFDSPQETFSVTLVLAANGNHFIRLRARNSAGNVSAPSDFVAVIPDPVDGGLDTWLAPPAGLPSGGSPQSIHGFASSFQTDGTPGAALARVEYRINGGEWRIARAQDGAFDSAEEDFFFEQSLTGGAYLIEARAIDVNGKAEQNVARLSIHINYSSFIPIVQR
jgi:hypothetical protein